MGVKRECECEDLRERRVETVAEHVDRDGGQAGGALRGREVHRAAEGDQRGAQQRPFEALDTARGLVEGVEADCEAARRDGAAAVGLIRPSSGEFAPIVGCGDTHHSMYHIM